MTKGALRADSPSVLRAAAAVSASPGMATADIGALIGIAPTTAHKVLQAARTAGHVRAVHVEATKFGWFPVGPLADAAEKQWREIADERARKRNREGVARFKALMKMKKADPGPNLPGKPIRRRVKATKPLPFVCTAPASVFHLGGML